MKFGYYPGCSLHATAREFSESTLALVQALGVELEEIKDWACCGASSAHATNHLLGVALPARTLALAEAQGLSNIVAPCAACYGRLAGAAHELKGDAALKKRVVEVLQRPLEQAPEVINVLGFLQQVLPLIADRIKAPLQGLPVACYYGCLLLRPPEVTQFDDVEQPESMEAVCAAVGARPVPWNLRTECCGAGFSLSRTGSVIRMGRGILDDARAAGAKAVIVGCPMCHSNLDMRQAAMNREAGAAPIPILYITELVGLALGIDPKVLGLQRHYVSTGALLEGLQAGAKAEVG
ncbi:MAG: CoB--CoM heterodisulfide reductase iron-sulfur subunit B family protein [Pseudomonadota bacterium]